MPGQAIVTIGENQWSVSLATTYTELTTGLSGIASIPAGTGMLFILPEKQEVTVDTIGMNFPLDIIFISDSTVIDVVADMPPGYLVTEETPCDMFLEINAGEAALVEVGDTVNVTITQEPGFNLSSVISSVIPLAILGFVFAMMGGMTRSMGGSSSSTKQRSSPGNPKKLPKNEGQTRIKIPEHIKEFAHNMDLINPEYSLGGVTPWQKLGSLHTEDLIRQLTKHEDLLFIRKLTIEKTLFYTVENVNGKLVLTDRSYNSSSGTRKLSKGVMEGSSPKEPWQMTLEEYAYAEAKRYGHGKPRMDWIRAGYGETYRSHKIAVERAIKDGKPVPSEVMKDYPELAKVTPVTPEVTVKCPICGEEVEIPEYNKVTRSEALREHIGEEHRGGGLDWLMV